MANYDKQYEEDLERAQALSLESLALEQFRNKRLQEINNISKTKSTSVSRASSMNESDSNKFDRQFSKSRPRPGNSQLSHSPSGSLIAPPPASQRKSSSSSSINDTPDLISFASPPPTTSTNDIIKFYSQQSFSTNQMSLVQQNKFFPTTATIRPFPNSPAISSAAMYPSPGSTVSDGFVTLRHPNSPFNVSLNSQMGNLGSTPMQKHFQSAPSSIVSPLQPPMLPPKNQQRPPPPPLPPNPHVLKKPKPLPTKSSQNLIDFAPTIDDKNSVRVSILQEFDPMFSESLYNHSLRTISPECNDDAVSVAGSCYDSYDPYDIYTGSGNNSISDPIYATVIKSDSVQSSPASAPPIPPRTHMSTLDKRLSKCPKLQYNLLNIVQRNQRSPVEAKDSDLKAFYQMVFNVRNSHHYNDPNTNMGLIVSPIINYPYTDGLSIKLCVHPDFDGADFNSPVSFTCDVTTSVEHVTLQLTCELDAPAKDKYTLKVWGFNEYLAPTTLLSDYEYVHNCIKLDEDIVLILIPDSKVDKSFARTLQDDNRDKELTFEDVIPNELVLHITYDHLKILLETVENEIDKLEKAALELQQSQDRSSMPALQPTKVIQSVKCVTNLMGNLYTLDLMNAVELLNQSGTTFIEQNFGDTIASNCKKVRMAIQNLLEMYCKAFTVDFDVILPSSTESSRIVSDVSDTIVVHLCGIYRPSNHWKYDRYSISSQIFHGMRPIGQPRTTHIVEKTESDKWPQTIIFDYWFAHDDVSISSLARESRLVILIFGLKEETSDNDDKPKNLTYTPEEIGWASIQFFNYDGMLAQGSWLLSVWAKGTPFDHMYGPAPPAGTYTAVDHPMVGIEIAGPENCQFPTISNELFQNIQHGDFNSLDAQTQQQLLDCCEQDMLYKVPPDVREVLWDKRHYLYHIPEALPKVLVAAHSWAYSNLPDLHGMLSKWRPLKPIQALELLLPVFPDVQVRKQAVKWIQNLSNDELVDFLPQLVVALRHETYENSELAKFLLDRALRSPRFAHHLFWLLSHSLPGASPQNYSSENFEREETEPNELRHHRRKRLLLRSLLAICGESLRKCFVSQQLLVKELNDTADEVKRTKDSHRLTILQTYLQSVDNNLRESPTSLPLSPTLRVCGVQVTTCSYFPSNTLPLKINFMMNDRSIIPAIYKVGDDLQQDMLTLQMVRIMDKLWLQQRLDLRMVAFRCVPTGKKKGMIEMVTKAETLRKIQVEHGLTGSFKDKPIAEWLAKHNPSELEYQRAVENFTASCAGYCVVTYILGICDRHNDNIMLKTTGHLFHIDFGKFLGDAQMFKNFKRDRAPFVLTSDMAYVINGGDRPAENFHHFVDLCCKAFNIIRSNRNLFLYLFTLMASSGICGVTRESVGYLHNVLLPGMSNPEAAATFARMIESSLKSWFTQFNFFLHNLAQLKFTSDNSDGTLLSFVPKTFSKETDGRIVGVDVVGYRKRYDPDKYYVYLLRVEREGQKDYMEILRTYKEFCELHQKLCLYFPLAKLSSLSTGLHMGRSNIKQVAQKRFAEISLFIKTLFTCADEIRHSELVYTFFHPMLRDQQYPEMYSKKLKDRNSEMNGAKLLKGQLKLSLQYSKNAFCVMVHHVRGLPRLANGQEPSTYVKVYLCPDETKSTKRKTKVVKKNCHPSFMEMLEYRMTKDVVQTRTLRATVWCYDALQENEFKGGVELDLSKFNLSEETTEWYSLTQLCRDTR